MIEKAGNQTGARRPKIVVLAFASIFLVISLVGLNGAFVSTHNERQNQTYDTARHVFQNGWQAVLSPRASFSLPGYETLPFTVTEQEVPFHGLFGWPFVAVVGHERAVVRLVSTAFGLLSIFLIYAIVRAWLPPWSAAGASALWATAPLVLQFGQVPMPDILCTTGMLAAFWCALRKRLYFSSACFLFALLAKSSVIVFGLPILVAVLVSREATSLKDAVRNSLLWGITPLAGLIVWVVLTWVVSPDTPWTLWKVFSERGDVRLLLRPNFYILTLGCLLVAGVGVLGFFAFLAARKGPGLMDPRIKWSLVIANLLYLCVIVQKIPEPQYFLPPLAWMLIAGAFGFEVVTVWWRRSFVKRAFLISAAVLHVLVLVLVTCELKSSRVSDLTEIEKAAEVLPPGARVIAAYRFYGGSAAVWLNHNVIAVHGIGELEHELPKLLDAGFTHLVIFKVDHRYEFRLAAKSLLTAIHRFGGVWRMSPASPEKSEEVDPDSTLAAFCDRNFTKLFRGGQVSVYSIPRNFSVVPTSEMVPD